MLSQLTGDQLEYYVKVVLRRFFDKGDEDYVSARILCHHHLPSSFFWAAQQCLEKYLKAALLLRGMEIMENHDLKWHFQQLRPVTNVNLPKVLVEPNNLKKLPLQSDEKGNLRPCPFKMELTQFVSKIDKMGSANSRYNEADFAFEPYDLVRFDLVAKIFREAAIETDQLVIYREIANGPDSLGRILFGRIPLTNETFAILKLHNYAYWPDSQETELPFGITMRNNLGPDEFLNSLPDYRSAMSFLSKKIVWKK